MVGWWATADLDHVNDHIVQPDPLLPTGSSEVVPALGCEKLQLFANESVTKEWIVTPGDDIHIFLAKFLADAIAVTSAPTVRVISSEFRRDLHASQRSRGCRLTPDNQVPARIKEVWADSGFSHKRSNSVTKYEFDLPKMKAFLIKKNIYDEDATY